MAVSYPPPITENVTASGKSQSSPSANDYTCRELGRQKKQILDDQYYRGEHASPQSLNYIDNRMRDYTGCVTTVAQPDMGWHTFIDRSPRAPTNPERIL